MSAPTPAAQGGIGSSTLLTLTAAKCAANVALRWIPPFLATLERAFAATTGTLTTLIGIGELAGVSTLLTGRRLDRGGEQRLMVAALLSVSASAALCLVGTLWAFGIGMVLLVGGVANFTVAGHAYITHRVTYFRRARVIGLFELSWALSLLLVAPLLALGINLFGWRAPFVFVCVATAVGAAAVHRSVSRATAAADARTAPVVGDVPGPTATSTTPPSPAASAGARPLPGTAWLTSLMSALLAASGIGVFVIAGSWFNDEFGLTTTGIGAIVVGFGAAELLSSGASAWIADSAGKINATLLGAATEAIGLLLMYVGRETAWAGVVGVVVVLIGFEFAFVTSLSLVSESAPDTPGTVLAAANAMGTVGRAAATIASGWLYTEIGITGTLAMSSGLLAGAVGCLCVGGRSARHLNVRHRRVARGDDDAAGRDITTSVTS